MQKGKFIVIDGMDRTGKTTQINLLRKKLSDSPVLFTREPGGTERGALVRKILLDKELPTTTALMDLLLFFADREDHLHMKVLPALERGIHVLSDRGPSSTDAFQINGEQRKDLLPAFVYLHKLVLGENVPDAYVILELDPHLAFERSRDAAKETRFDLKPIEYHERVREGFRRFPPKGIPESPKYMIDASGTVEDVHEDIWKVVSDILEMK